MLPTRSFLDRRLWERKYIDLWALVHLLNGVCFGFAVFFFNLPFVPSLIIFVIAIIFWEVMEFFMHVREPVSNQVIDVLAGALGFWLTYQFLPLLAGDLLVQIIYFTLIYIVVWTLAYYGFQSFALHFNREMEKYNKSFYAAAIIYVSIIISLFLI